MKCEIELSEKEIEQFEVMVTEYKSEGEIENGGSQSQVVSLNLFVT